MDGIKIQLKELYDDKELRKHRKLEREKRLTKNMKPNFDDFEGIDKGYGSSPSSHQKEDEN